MQKLLKKIKTHLSKQDSQSDIQDIVIPLNEKVINPITNTNVTKRKAYCNKVIHNVVLLLNDKLNVFGIGEITSYQLNNKDELVLNLSFYDST